MSFLPFTIVAEAGSYDFREDAERLINNGLTDKEIEEGYFIDPVLGRCNLKKAMQERSEAIRSEYEAFDILHSIDGTLNKCVLKL